MPLIMKAGSDIVNSSDPEDDARDRKRKDSASVYTRCGACRLSVKCSWNN